MHIRSAPALASRAADSVHSGQEPTSEYVPIQTSDANAGPYFGIEQLPRTPFSIAEVMQSALNSVCVPDCKIIYSL